jgi:lipid II:glycine glycyltransferase (peptidoglycan interpeptide bridge formation enzyme)
VDIRLLTEKDRKDYDRLAGHPVQSWEWGEFRKDTGNEILRIGLFEKEKLVEGYLLTLHRLPYTSYRIATFLKGPTPTEKMLDALKAFARVERIVFIRMEPNVEIKQTDGEEQRGKLERLMAGNGAVHGRRFFTNSTFVVNLRHSEEELLARMHPKTRYNIRVGLRHGVTVTEESSKEAFSNYLRLMEETTRRQKFFAHTRKYHLLMWRHLHKAGIAHLLTAKYGGETLISWVVFVWHDTLYYPYGASSEKNRNVMASYVMMWEAIKFGRKKNLSAFDLWGKEEGRGFTKFKEGFNPETVDFLGTWDLVVSPFIYQIYKLVEKLRWVILRLPLPLPKPRF